MDGLTVTTKPAWNPEMEESGMPRRWSTERSQGCRTARVGHAGNRVGWAGEHPNTCLKLIQEEMWAEEEEIYLKQDGFHGQIGGLDQMWKYYWSEDPMGRTAEIKDTSNS